MSCHSRGNSESRDLLWDWTKFWDIMCAPASPRQQLTSAALRESLGEGGRQTYRTDRHPERAPDGEARGSLALCNPGWECS